MKYNTTKNEKEMKQQEIKKLQTIGTWENGKHHCQQEQQIQLVLIYQLIQQLELILIF